LTRFDLPTLQALADPYAIKILECHTELTDVRVLVSL
jgi:hypothetical protein